MSSPHIQLEIFEELAHALATGDRPALYGAVDRALQSLVGHKLFTLLIMLPGGK